MTESRVIAVVGVRPVTDAVAAAFPGDHVVRVNPSTVDSMSGRADVDILVHVVDVAGHPLGTACRDIAMLSNPPQVVVLVSDLSSDGLDDWHDLAAIAALRAATEQLAADLRPARVNAVAIRHANQASDQENDHVAHTLAYLTGPNATLLTGQCLTIDGTLAIPDRRPAAVEERVRTSADDDAVVVVGMGVALPGAGTPEELWELLRGEHAVFGEPGDRLDLANLWSPDPNLPDHTYTRVSGFMNDFRPHHSLPPIRGGQPTDYTATWLRHCIAQATDGITVTDGDRHLFAVGLTADGSHHLEQSIVVGEVRRLLGERDEDTDALLRELFPLAVDDPEQVLPYRIARQAATDLPSDTEITVLDMACSSSLYSIDLGARALRSGSADLALCGGAFALSAQNLVLFAKLRGLSRSGAVRPLDRAADGVLFSDGAAVLALKTHTRAKADGDRVLGFIAGFGGSSDGRGKAIYAPNPAGQRIALRRAWSAAEVEPADIDWVIAHATGTPTGDRTELSVLADMTGPGKTWTVSSNKALIGHTGWAAGAVSAVHALLALRHQVIPAQRCFTELPDGLDPAVLHVPTDDIEWLAAQDRRRTVAVSAMGFGGTNGHLLLTDTPPARTAPKARPDEPIVLSAWAAHLPGDPDRDRIRRWLGGASPDWPTSFGENYPLPSPVELRLAPSAIAAMDRSQLMAVRCADLLAGEWSTDRDLTARSGVFVGHTGPTRAAVYHDTRCYLGGLQATAETRIAGFQQRVVKPVLAAVSAANEDSYPGLMPNIIPARIAQRLDLHGPNMALDAGLDSFLSALATAVRYLRDGEIDLAVVIGVGAAAEHVRPRDGRTPAEAAIGFVVTRQSIAEVHSLPVLAHLDTAPGDRDGAAVQVVGDRVHHGAEGAVTLLRALHGPAGRTVLAAQEDTHTPTVLVTPRRDVPALRKVMRRHSLVLRPTAARRTRTPLPAIPPGSLVVTDNPDAIRALGLPERCVLVAPGTHEAMALPSSAHRIDHVRIVLTGAAEFPTVLAVNDLAFAAAQACVDGLDDGGSVAVLVLDGFDGAIPRPAVGLFTGLVRSIEQELTGCLAFVLVTDTTEVAAGLTELAEESAHHRYLPAAYRREGTRSELMVEPVEPVDGSDRLGVVADPVIVATGGARGLTARLVRELVTDGPPRSVWLLGTGPEPDLTAPTEMPPKPQAIRALMAKHPREKPAALNRRYEAAVREADRVATILDLHRSCGADRVHYRQCDVRDAAAVTEVVGDVLAAEGRVDVVVHGAGLVRSTALARKDLDDYRLVRDVKVVGDHNLRAALAGRRPALWCSISSVGAFIGMRGEADYEAGNEYLLLAAAQARAAGHDEVALVSGLWVESGMAAGYTVGSPFTTGLADFTQLTDEQGIEFFRTEVAGRGGAGLATTWVGEAEWSTLHRTAPGLRDAAQAPSMCAGTRGPAFLATAPEPDGDRTTWHFEIDLDRHRWLLNHLVDDRPTVPATIMLAMAAEAAVHLAPGLVPVRMTDVVLSRFIRAPRSRWPRPLTVTATRTGATVVVGISTPAAGPVPAQEHARITVWLARTPNPAEPHPQPRRSGIEVPDVYQLDGPVRLSGVFANLRDARLHDDGGSAELHLPPPGEPLDDLVIPAVVLDSLLRTVVLDGRAPESIPVVVPTALAQIDFHTTGNDAQLLRRWGHGITLRHWSDPSGTASRCTAVAADGTVLLRISGITTSVRDSYDLAAGRWRSHVTPALR